MFFFSGISAAKVLAENGIEEFMILEASDRIGGRIRKESFGGVSVELGAGWIAGVGGEKSNPAWELANKSGLRTCFSDYSNARYNIYDTRYPNPYPYPCPRVTCARFSVFFKISFSFLFFPVRSLIGLLLSCAAGDVAPCRHF